MRTPFQFTVYYLWKATIARKTAAIMYTNIWQRFCVSYQTKTGDTRQSPSLCWGASGDSLEEIPHAHADLVQSFLHAVVVPILLFWMRFMLSQTENSTMSLPKVPVMPVSSRCSS